ncbi:hypothetical protein [Streptomyces otsuchiensis]|uniref:hypothetical protein n=1 Tax=Streptomyces otsuchiensis TaxID=2681388 RepID=UPI00102F6D62|nr:hypothetical protein [Streptomyces otsuchiensis]
MNDWQCWVARFPLGVRVRGRVVRVMPFGAFVSVEAGPEALFLAKVSRMPRGARLPLLGDAVEGEVVHHDGDLQQIHLVLAEWKEAAHSGRLGEAGPKERYKELRGRSEAAWPRIVAEVPVGAVVHGEVFEKLPMGVAFASVDEEPDALAVLQPEDQPDGIAAPEIGEHFTATVERHRDSTRQLHLSLRPPGDDG